MILKKINLEPFHLLDPPKNIPTILHLSPTSKLGNATSRRVKLNFKRPEKIGGEESLRESYNGKFDDSQYFNDSNRPWTSQKEVGVRRKHKQCISKFVNIRHHSEKQWRVKLDLPNTFPKEQYPQLFAKFTSNCEIQKNNIKGYRSDSHRNRANLSNVLPKSKFSTRIKHQNQIENRIIEIQKSIENEEKQENNVIFLGENSNISKVEEISFGKFQKVESFSKFSQKQKRGFQSNESNYLRCKKGQIENIERNDEGIKNKSNKGNIEINPYTKKQYLYFQMKKQQQSRVKKSQDNSLHYSIIKPCQIKSFNLAPRSEIRNDYEKKRKEQKNQYLEMLAKFKKKSQIFRNDFQLRSKIHTSYMCRRKNSNEQKQNGQKQLKEDRNDVKPWEVQNGSHIGGQFL